MCIMPTKHKDVSNPVLVIVTMEVEAEGSHESYFVIHWNIIILARSAEVTVWSNNATIHLKPPM